MAEDAPLHVSLVAVPGSLLLPIAGLYEVLTAFPVVAGFHEGVPSSPPFAVEIVGTAQTNLPAASGLPITIQRAVDRIDRTDIIIVPTMAVEERRETGRHNALFDDVLARGRELSVDPLEAFLIGLKLLAETVADLPEAFPGCLVATFCYQERLFDTDVHALYHEIVLDWRARFRSCLDAICERYEPAEEVDLDAVADTVSTAIEGGMVLVRATGDSAILPAQIMMVRTTVRLLFRPLRGSSAN